MTLEERIEKEREKNDWLARKIAKLEGESMADFGHPLRHSQALRHGQYLVELLRQKKESDEWLASLRQQMPSNKTGVAASSSRQYKKGQKTSPQGDEEVAKRRALVKSNPNVPAKEMCEIFDSKKVPLPSKWPGAGFRTWTEAYRNLQHGSRIRVLISKDRKAD